ncbi:RHS repeat-associated core domain-containing protein [Candidatus Thiodiazotropha sp. CDECU1]|uniref:RHS repeat-associated core domain-containing protein n=1 Tax=Candidatus Thiodiazotropha sp. CDECU1 TaxID=3065865 RepID=UPI00292CDF82|nr:RHS repeat-associated core domain-containing protein [Candidatus Thiodiazotropha sp. CDECU1]
MLNYKECSMYSGLPEPTTALTTTTVTVTGGNVSTINKGPQILFRHDGYVDHDPHVCNFKTIKLESSGTYTAHLRISTKMDQPGVQGLDRKGAIYAYNELDVGNLSCTNSAGDTVPGCGEPPIPEKTRNQAARAVAAAGASANGAGSEVAKADDPCDEVGGPINYFYGYKHKDQLDYANGVLSFVRNYRSDRDWIFSPVMGDRWRHNFEGKITYSEYSGNKFADVVNSAGAVVMFYNEGSGWVPYYDDVTATLTGDSTNGFTFTTNNDTTYLYSGAGELERIEYQGHEAVNLSYNATSGLLETVSNEHGQSLTFNYNTDGYLSSVVTPTGTFTYGYDTDFNLISVTKPDTKVVTYNYDDTNWPHALTSIEDERGETIGTYTYNAVSGKALTTSSPVKVGGSMTDSTYSVAYNTDRTVTVTNPLGKQTTYHFTTVNGLQKLVDVEGHASTNCAAANKSYSYTDEGWLAGKTDWEGNVTSYGYDAYNRLDTITEDDGGPDERETVVTYTGTSGHLADTITMDGLVIDYDYDSDNRLTQVTYTDTAATPNVSRVHGFSYYANSTDGNGNTVLGKLQTYTNPRGYDTDLTYDASGLLDTVTNEKGHVWDVYSRDSAGRITEILDPNGTKDKIDYDALGRMTKYTQANNRSAPVKGSTTYAYYDDGALYKTTLANGVYLKNYYDEAGRLEKINSSDSGEYYYFDDAGNVLETKRKKIGGSITYRYFKEFDELSRLLSTHHTNDDVSYAYDKNSNVTSITDGNDYSSTLDYDGLNRLIQHTDRRGGVSDFTYSPLDDLLGVAFGSTTDSDSNSYPVELETTYSVNSFGDVESESSPDRGTTTYSYDANGNVTQRVDAEGRTVQYGYDEIDRLTGITYPNDSTLNVTLTYDSASGCGASDGRLCTVYSPSFGTVDYVYDDAGRVTQVSETPAGATFSLDTYYGYDAANYVTSVIYPSGREVTYSYNLNGEVTEVTAEVNSTVTTLADSMVYMPFGPVESMDYGNGLSEANTYDAGNRLLTREVTDGVTPVMDDTYTYDSNGNVDSVNGEKHSYSRNDELVKQGAFEYLLDGAGNRLEKSRWSQNIDIDYLYAYDGTSYGSRIEEIYDGYASSTIAGITLDDAGMTDSYGSQSYIWDEAGRLIEVKQGASTLGAYAYDPQNRRTAKTAGSTTVYYVHGRGGALYGEYDGTGALVREYVHFDGRPLAQVDAGTSEALTYLHTDHLGTPREGTDDSGSSVWSWAYAHNVFGDTPPTGSATVNLRMPGQYADAESGLFYNHHRYYDPATGRYISSDPIGLAGGLNTFAYAMANPANYTDPEGLRASAPARGVPYLSTCLQILEFFQGRPLCNNEPACCKKHGLECPQPVFANEANQPEQPAPGKKAGSNKGEEVPGEEGEKLDDDYGDLTEEEIQDIQDAVDAAGRPIDIVGSAVDGERTEDSDIDYTTVPANKPYFDDPASLPGIDEDDGILQGAPDRGSESIRFEPGVKPRRVRN